MPTPTKKWIKAAGHRNTILKNHTVCYLQHKGKEYVRADTAVTLSLRPFPIFCATLCLRIQQFRTLNKVQCLADGDVGKVTWFQETMAQVPKS
jgi:hypothetical protein